MMGCAEVIAALGDYLEGEVGEELRRQLHAHLAHCRTCQLLYDSASKTLKIVSESGCFTLPPEISEQMVEQIMDRVRVYRREHR
jgi:predicted anti-sigma-YlaC factor YlaD